jgi:hypothetical protein
MIGLYILQIIFNDTHIYLRLIRLLKAFSSITDMWESKFSSTERSDLGDDFCRSLFVLCPLDILLSVALRFMDSDYLFGIFKFLLHINSKELLAQA